MVGWDGGTPFYDDTIDPCTDAIPGNDYAMEYLKFTFVRLLTVMLRLRSDCDL